MVHEFKNFVGDSSWATIEAQGKSTLAPSLSPVYLQIYNRNTATWVTIDTDSESSADIDFVLAGTVLDLTDYKNSQNLTTCRVYQVAI